MPDYKKMYLHLASQVADAVDLLVKAQQDCEELYLSDPEPDLKLLPPRPKQREEN